MDQPLYVHRTEVPFGDTDASGWMHFPNIFRYVEAAEHAFLKSRGIVIIGREEGGWPRVKVGCEYKRPLHTGDEIEIQLAITKIGGASIVWDFEVLKDGELAAFGSMTNVRVDKHGKPQIISDEERAKLQ